MWLEMRFHDDNIPKEVTEEFNRVGKLCEEELPATMRILIKLRNRCIEEGEKEAGRVCRKYGVVIGEHKMLTENIVSSVMDGKGIAAEYDGENDEWVVLRERDDARRQKYSEFLVEMARVERGILENIIFSSERIPRILWRSTQVFLDHAEIYMDYSGKKISGLLTITNIKDSNIIFSTPIS